MGNPIRWIRGTPILGDLHFAGSEDFYTLFVACSFCQIPFVALSTDLAQQVPRLGLDTSMVWEDIYTWMCPMGFLFDEALPLHQAPAISLPSLDSQEAPRNFRLASSPLRWAVDGLLALERKQLQVRTCNSEPDRQKDSNVQVQK